MTGNSNTSTLYIYAGLIFVVLYAGLGISCIRCPEYLTSHHTCHTEHYMFMVF